jgi:hypothetical protein
MADIFISGELCEASGFYWPIHSETGKAEFPIVVNEKFPALDGHFELACTPEQFVSGDLVKSLEIENEYKKLLQLSVEALEALPDGEGPAGLYDAVQEGLVRMGMGKPPTFAPEP